jgi:hypothetical protein
MAATATVAATGTNIIVAMAVMAAVTGTVVIVVIVVIAAMATGIDLITDTVDTRTDIMMTTTTTCCSVCYWVVSPVMRSITDIATEDQ